MRFHQYHIITTLLLAAAPLSAQAALTLLSGPPTTTHVGNLVVNGSFETGSPGPGPGNIQYWATGTTFTPFSVPPGWSSTGLPTNYAQWGADSGTSPWTLRGSDTIPDGNVGMYFGNGLTTFNVPPTYHANGRVTYPIPPTSSKGPPVELWQSVPTQLTPSPSYLLSFWVSGEDSVPASGWGEGVFGLQVTNVLPGDPIEYFAVPSGSGPQGNSRFYEFSFIPLNPLAPVTIDFLNWGHVDTSGFGGGFNTELVLDDVVINAVPEPASLAFLSVGCIALLRRRRRRSQYFRFPISNWQLTIGNRQCGMVLLIALTCFCMANRSVQAAFTQNTGAQIATPTGNLVTNGSFENGAPAPGYANQVYWATGTTNTPFAVPPGWTSSGQPSTYALWGSDAPAGGLIFSDTIPDGQAAMYFGNADTTVSPAPTYGPNHNVTFGSPPTFTPSYGGPSKLWQTVNTPATPAPSYVLNFWVSGEDATINGFTQPGVFGLKVTNVLAGDPQMYFEVPNTSINPSFRLEFFFTPLNTSLPVTVEFTNWGHIDNNPNNGMLDATELVLDDVIINALPEPASLLMLSVGGLLILKRRWRTTQYPA